MKQRTWSDTELIVAVRESNSLRQTLIRLSLAPQGGSYKVVKNHIDRLKLDTSHWTGQAWRRGAKTSVIKKLDLKEILTKDSTYQSSKLRKRLIKEGYLENKCSSCNQIPIWNGGPLTLHLDHINGINNDHRLENLRLLCPNCHSQTITYCGKNKKR